MAIYNARGSSRAVRRSVSKNLLLAPPKTRKGLLLGSSYAGGALMVLGATLLMPNAAEAACSGAAASISCLNATDGTNYSYNGSVSLTFDPGLSWTGSNQPGSPGTTGYFNLDVGATASNSIEFKAITNGMHPTMTLNDTTNGIGIQLLSGVNGSITISEVDPGVTVTSGNDGLRLRTGDAGGTGTNALTGTGSITLTSAGVFFANQTNASGQGIDAKAGSGGVTVEIQDHGQAKSNRSQGLAAEAGNNGNVAVTVDHGGLVQGGVDTTTAGSGLFAFITTSGSTGKVSVTNNGEVLSTSAAGTNTLGLRSAGVEAVSAGTGSVSVVNESDGTIISEHGAGVYESTGGAAYFENHSYHTVMGTDGLYIATAGQATVDNTGGLTAGLTNDGANINNITGTGLDSNGNPIDSSHPAVGIDNTKGGIFAGAQNGISIDNVAGAEGGDVVVDNYGTWNWQDGVHGGGLIVGLDDDGISATRIAGDFTVNNQLTRGSIVDLNDVDTAVYDSSNESGLLGDFAGGASGNGFVNSGIFGSTGIYGHHIGGNAVVNNEAGVIFGDGGAGVALSEVGGNVFVNNQNAWWRGDGGLIVGDQFGVQIGGDNFDGIGGGAYVNNRQGAIFGLEESGIAITNVGGWNAADGDNAVGIDNTHGGVIGGGVNGITVSDIYGTGSESNDVYIDNSGAWQHGHRAGGLIVGTGGDGISVTSTEGDVTIDNSLTRNWGNIDLADLSSESGSILSTLQYVQQGVDLSGNTGIWGMQDGVYGESIDGHVSVDNTRGVIVGIGDASKGIELANIGDGVEIDNSNWYAHPGETDNYSLIVGSGVGIDLTNIAGGVEFSNDRGITYSHNSAFVLDGATEGDVNISNSAGLIAGYFHDGIAITGATGNVNIENGYHHGGDILGGEGGSAITIGTTANYSIVGSESAEITNGSSWYDHTTDSIQGGLIAGAGTAGDPVIYLSTSEGDQGGASVTNYGIITGLGAAIYADAEDNSPVGESDAHLPGFTMPVGLGQTPGNLWSIYHDIANIGEFVATNGSEGDIGSLSTYRTAAQDVAIVGRNGHVDVSNESGAIVFGQVDLTGVNNNGEGDYNVANTFTNFGTWMTLGTNVVNGSSEGDSIHNEGLIQTAFGSESMDETTFNVDNFYNDYPAQSSVGVLSMLDGNVGDTITITDGQNGGNFYGAQGEGTSYLAIDANFDKWDENGGTEGADHFVVNGSVYGSTAVIVNKVNTDASGAPIGAAILFASDGDTQAYCTTTWCSTTDPYYLSSLSSDYREVQGAGFVGDGLVMWGIQQTKSGVVDNEYSLVSTAAPDADNQPVVISSLQSAFWDTSGVVEEHSYGNMFPNTPQGGGGADVTTTGAGKSSVLWGRLVGSWSDRDTTVTGSGLDLDTSANTSTYALQAGLELRPNADSDGVRLGLYGGYLSTNTGFDTYGGSSKGTGGTVGGYAALISGGWYLDGEVKADFLDVNYSSTSVSLDTTATTVGVLANTGYRMQNGASFFEPIASFAYANTTLGDASSGTDSITYNNGQSIRAGVGARLGTTMGVANGAQAQIDLTGRVWDEFGGPNSVILSDGNPADDVTLSDSISGVYGEVVGRATIYNADRSASGFVSVGGKFGSDMSSVEAKVGARKAF